MTAEFLLNKLWWLCFCLANECQDECRTQQAFGSTNWDWVDQRCAVCWSKARVAASLAIGGLYLLNYVDVYVMLSVHACACQKWPYVLYIDDGLQCKKCLLRGVHAG